MRIAAFLIAVLPLVAIAPTGCNDDVTNPSLGSLASLWPDDEGRSWSFAASWAEWEPDLADAPYVFTDRNEVPAFPSWDTMVAWLDAPPSPPDSVDDGSYSYDLRFEGTLPVTPSHTARNLQETYDGSDLVFCDGGDSTLSPGLLRHLSMRVPGLVQRLRLLGTDFIRPPNVLIHGGPFERTDEWIGTYGCVDSLLAWKFLAADLHPGATFTHQLLPSLADDVFLHTLVRHYTSIDTQAGRWNALEVDYAVDFGILGFTSASDPLPYAYGRVLMLGKVFYVSGVGPVASSEWNLIPVGREGLGVGAGKFALDLVSTSAPQSS